MTNKQNTNSPAPETLEPQKINPQIGELAKSTELDAEQLDKVAGGGGLVVHPGGGGGG